MDAVNKGNDCPYILAYGPDNSTIEKYYIVVEQNNIISVCIHSFIAT